MLAWKKSTVISSLLYQFRVAKAQYEYFDHYGLYEPNNKFLPRIARKQGHQTRLSELRDKHLNQPAVVICNGPSLADTPLDFISSKLSIGCNGIYKNFEGWGFHTDYLLFEDIDQFEIRASEASRVTGPVKMAAIYNAYCISSSNDFLFFNAPRRTGNWGYYFNSTVFPQFSKDFASIVHLGSTITYIMLQLAYHLGCDPVYIVGLDHEYSVPSTKDHFVLRITSDNIESVRRSHGIPNYYRIGDVIPLPRYDLMELAYAEALINFEAAGRKLFNASARSKLDILPSFTIEQ